MSRTYPRFTRAALALCVALASPSWVAAQDTLDDAYRLDQRVFQLLQQGKYAQAVPLSQRAVTIRKRLLGASHPDVATSLNNLADLYRAMAAYAQAEPLYRQALEIDRKALGQGHPDYARDLNNLAELYRAMAHYAQAEPLYRQALAIDRKALGEDDPDYARDLNNLATLYCAMGAYAQAEPLFRQARDIVRKAHGERHLDYATSLNNLAVLYYTMGAYAQAEPLYRQALAINEKVLGKEHPGYAGSLYNLAKLYRAMAAYAPAEPLYQQALAIDRKALGEDHPDYARDLNSLAVLYCAMGAYAQAEPLFRQALAIKEKVLGKQHPDYATNLNNLAELYRAMRDYAQAEPLYRQAMEIHRKALGEEHPSYAMSLNNLATLYDDMGNYAEAEPLYRQAMEIHRKALGEEHPSYATSLNNLATLYCAMGQYKEAEPLYRQALAIDRNALGEDHPDCARDLNNLAELYAATDRPTEAVESFGRGLQAEQSNLREVFGFSSEAAMRAYLSRIGRAYEALVGLAVTGGEGSGVGPTTGLTWVLRRKAILLEALCSFRDAQRVLEADPGVAAQAVRLRGLRKQLQDLVMSPPRGWQAGQLEAQRGQLRDKCERLEGELHRALSAHLGEPTYLAAQVESVRSQLPPEAALVELVRFDAYDFRATGKQPKWKPARYAAFVLTPVENQPPRMVDLGLAQPLDAAVSAWRDAMTAAVEAWSADPEGFGKKHEAGEEAKLREASRPLYAKVFAPLREALGSARMIYLAPDGELNRLPFGALVDEDGKYLAESYRFAYLGSGRDLLRERPAPAKGTVVFAGPDYDLKPSQREQATRPLLAALQTTQTSVVRGSTSRDLGNAAFAPLRGAEEEAAEVRTVLTDTPFGPVRCYQGAQALEEVFKALPAPRLLHLATHGFFLPDQEAKPDDRDAFFVRTSMEIGPGGAMTRLSHTENPFLRSGLVLAGANRLNEAKAGNDKDQQTDDGWVTAEEISSLDLRGTELVVLSACESGLGDVKCGEGVYGLRRAFLQAGAQTLITSLLKVPDVPTRELMGKFYGYLAQGKGKLESLHQAQFDTIKERRAVNACAHPFFWASFVLVGEAS